MVTALKMRLFAGVLFQTKSNTIDSIHVHPLELHLINIFIINTTMNILIWVESIVVVNIFQENSISIGIIWDTM